MKCSYPKALKSELSRQVLGKVRHEAEMLQKYSPSLLLLSEPGEYPVVRELLLVLVKAAIMLVPQTEGHIQSNDS